MDKSFRDAVAGETDGTPLAPPMTKPQLTITCDWQGTLLANRKHNFELFALLCEAAADGHRVIITSTSPADDIRFLVELAAEFGEIEGYEIAAINQFEIITKLDVVKMVASGELSVDLAFDNEDIATQTQEFLVDGKIKSESLNFSPKVEIRVNEDFSTFPLTMDGVRMYIGVLQRDAANPPLPDPTPR